MTLRDVIIHLARSKGHDVGDDAMITEMEWCYWIGTSIVVQKDTVNRFIKENKS